jgi:hypothetical protein
LLQRGKLRRLLKDIVAHGLTVSPPNRDKLTMRSKPLKSLAPILSLSKDEGLDFRLFQQPVEGLIRREFDRSRGFEGLIIELRRNLVSGRYEERRQGKERHEKKKREPDGEFPRHDRSPTNKQNWNAEVQLR